MKPYGFTDPPYGIGLHQSEHVLLVMQAEMFPEHPGLAPSTPHRDLIDTLPEPYTWEEETKNQFAIELISETWQSVVQIFKERFALINKPKPADFMEDYEATLGWLLGYWKGSIPLDLVIDYENSLQKNVYDGGTRNAIKHILAMQPVAQDCDNLRKKLCGGDLFIGATAL